MSEHSIHLTTHSSFEMLTEDETQRICERSRLRKFSRGSSVYLPQDDSRTVLLLVTGRIRLSHITSAGKESILLFVQPLDLFGELALCGFGPRDEYCEAASDAEVLALPADELRHVMRSNPDFGFAMMSLIAFRRRRVERRLKSVLFHTTRHRLSCALMDLARDCGEPSPQGIRLGVSLSHQELANLIGATRETVTIILGQLRREQILKFDRRTLVILQPEGLAVQS